MSRIQFDKLENLVNLNTSNENNCRDALIPFAEKLIGNKNLIFSRVEWSNDRGRVDLILIVEPIETKFDAKYVSNDKIAIVFEMKAPNKSLFKFHNSKRFIPSNDLSLAESQLFDYTNRLMLDLNYLTQTFGATEVRPGGIIIGRRSTMFQISKIEMKKITDLHKFEILKKMTINSRKRFLYDKASINIYTWDHIIDIIRPTL